MLGTNVLLSRSSVSFRPKRLHCKIPEMAGRMNTCESASPINAAVAAVKLYMIEEVFTIN